MQGPVVGYRYASNRPLSTLRIGEKGLLESGVDYNLIVV